MFEDGKIETQKIIQKLFIFADNRDLQSNREQNLIVNPEMLRILISQISKVSVTQKLNIFQSISEIFASNSLNTCILANRDKEILEFNYSIFDDLISFALSLKLDLKENNKLISILQPFIYKYPVTCRNIKNVISKIAKDFYEQKFNHQKLNLAIRILELYFVSQVPISRQPNCYFFMYGPNSGVRLLNQDLKWSLFKGFYFYVRFSIQDKKHEQMNLLQLYVNEDQFQLSIDEEDFLQVKVFSVTKKFRLRKLQTSKWYFLKMAYCLKTGIIRNSFQIVVHIEGEPYEIRDLPVPSPKMNDSIQELGIGRNFYGKINVAAISRNELHHWPKNGVNNWQQLDKMLLVNKDKIRSLFVLYSPLITTQFKDKKIVYEITSQNHAQILQNTGIFHNPFDCVDINYYAGIYTILPFFYIIRFYKYDLYESALQDSLTLILQLFESGYKNIEEQAINCQLCSIIGQFINQIDQRYLTQKALSILGSFRDIIQNQILLEEYFYQLLWKIRTDRLSNPKIVDKLFRLISKFYYKDYSWAINIMSLQNILWYIIDNFEPKNRQKCCLLHCWELLGSQSLDEDIIISIREQYKRKTEEIQNLLKFICVRMTQGMNFTEYFQNYNILKFCLHNYSICFKSLVLNTLYAGIKEQPIMFMEKTNILQTSYCLLEHAEIKDEIVPIVRILSTCIKAKNQLNILSVKEIIDEIGNQLDKLYMKKYAQIRLRSRSEGFSFNQRISERKYSNNHEDTKVQSKVNNNIEKQKQIKERIIRLKGQRKVRLQNDKELFDLIISICFQKTNEGGQVLIDEYYITIVQPYFKICCLKLKVKIIEMVRNTVLILTKLNVNHILQSIQKLDRIYKFMLSEFILKELDPEYPDYIPNENTNYINRNVFFIINHVIGLLKNSWHDLYQFLLRLISLLQEAKKDVKIKTKRPISQIIKATKIFVRKLILRILNHTENTIENMTNVIFLVYLVTFNNENETYVKKFDYFQALEKFFFMQKIQILSINDHLQNNKISFLDKKMILETLKTFKPEVDLDIRGKKLSHSIRAYFQKQNNEYHTYLLSIRQIFLSRAQFKPINTPETKVIRNMMSMFMNQQEQQNNQFYIYVAQIIFLLLSLSLQASLNEHLDESVEQSIYLYEYYSKLFILSCSKDNLKKSEHDKRNKKFPKNIAYYCIHYLYYILENNFSQNYKRRVQNSLYNILEFTTSLMNILSEKIGHPQTIEDALMLSDVMQDVQEFNYFTFQVFHGVITLPQIRLFPTLDKEKAIQIMYHSKMKNHFKNTPKIFIEKQMKEVVEIHRLNIQILLKEVQEKLQYQNITRQIRIENMITYEESQFEEQILKHIKKFNLQYRQTMRIWRKIWKRLRVYHYYWSVSMNQKEEMNEKWSKFRKIPFKHKFGKFTHLSGLRPILQIEPKEPWHVRKAQLDQEISYRASNFMLNLYKSSETSSSDSKPKSFFEKLFTGTNKVQNQFLVDWIKYNSTRRGFLKLTQEKLIFTYDSTYQKDTHVNFTSFTLAEYKPIQKNWSLVTITNIMRRRYLAQNQCILIEFQDSSCLIFNFRNRNLEDFLSKIQNIQNSKSQMSNFLKLNKVNFYTKNFNTSMKQSVDEVTYLWKNEKISNLHYLMEINKLSGRSFLDPVNYPVLPWIISNYDCKELIFRDLGKTLGALGLQSRKESYINKYISQDPFNHVEPYQYGTHYSSPGVIFNFLIRLSPYTQAGRTLQGGRFDLSDRIFSSLKICWHSVTTQVSDVRELIPEFFYLPEFLINIEHHDFGVTQLKERVHDVKLPLWGPNAYEFIVTQRRVFESDHVSENINKWIDLIFGFKQKGKLAQENLNLYYYLTYENAINLNEIEDEIERTSIQAQIIHFGQTPSQIFHKPHPEKSKNVGKGSELFKVKYLGTIQTKNQLSILSDNKFNQLFIFKDPSLLCVSCHNFLEIKSQTPLLRANSRQNLYHMEDLTIYNRVQIFGNNNFIILGSYINGDIIVYSVGDGKKLIHKKGAFKSYIYINEDENLILCGCKNGLLQVYEIIYTESGGLLLTLISSEYYMYPIEHISEGAGFYTISSGNLIVVNKINRGLAYVNKKQKMKGCKMIRSLESKRKVLGSYIITNPLYCVVFYNFLQINVYSINGQYLKSKQIELVLRPVVIKMGNFEQQLVVVQPNILSFLRLPELDSVQNIALPQKQFTQIKVLSNRIYLVTNNGEILFFYYKQA